MKKVYNTERGKGERERDRETVRETGDRERVCV